RKPILERHIVEPGRAEVEIERKSNRRNEGSRKPRDPARRARFGIGCRVPLADQSAGDLVAGGSGFLSTDGAARHIAVKLGKLVAKYRLAEGGARRAGASAAPQRRQENRQKAGGHRRENDPDC